MSSKKKRIPISDELSAEVMFSADRTCCVCNERGKAVQVHHIDEDPSNNDFENLAVVCLQCHDDTQIKGGFGRKLNAELVVKYRGEWLVRVRKRRDEADQNAISRVSGRKRITHPIGTIEYSEERNDAILDYVNSLPKYRKELWEKLQPQLDTGVTATVVQASYDHIDALQGVLVTMADFYPPSNFDGEEPHRFFSNQVSMRFAWHRSYAEPDGPATGGTIVNILVVSNVVSDVEKMVADMAESLVWYDDRFDWRGWRKLWVE